MGHVALEDSAPLQLQQEEPASRRLPPELVRLCLEHAQDWELATTLGIRSPRLPITSPWLEFATPLDKAILRSSLSLTPIRYALAQGHTSWSSWGTRVMVRFSLLPVLQFFLDKDPQQLQRQCRNLLPVVASAWGRTEVLEWALKSRYSMNPPRETVEEAVDDASRHGQVAVLDFWLNSGLPMHYSEKALASATIKRQLGSLEWWRNSGLPLKIGNVLDFASMEGTTVCLDWWSSSGLPVRYSKAALHSLSRTGNVPLLDWWLHSRFALLYDKEVILIATRYGQTGALTWWLQSGLEMEYRFFDIEEALEDSVGEVEKERSQRWWEMRGYDVALGTNEWTRIRDLRDEKKGVWLGTTTEANGNGRKEGR
ncbi:hypothetical protein BCR35DRAFT_303916 [Leucosporidium creatinivorum]|uniref:Uncharacterized protein n=1 Tax=Leucosporidium creatinivorum TaxID=106004 RepID=A0A1Y2FDS6_9BASI|nr:hypothetical protein BCR35DRAFT_303916 [Leucosporidium creatinivorum]